MSTTFESCNDTVHALLRQVMRDHHNALNANEVTIDAIWARRTDEDENGDETLVPALKQHGHPVAARIQITSRADRERGVADAKLTIDSCAWGGMSEQCQ